MRYVTKSAGKSVAIGLMPKKALARIPDDLSFSGVFWSRFQNHMSFLAVVTTADQVLAFGSSGDVVWSAPLLGLRAETQGIDALRLTAADGQEARLVGGVGTRTVIIKHILDAVDEAERQASSVQSGFVEFASTVLSSRGSTLCPGQSVMLALSQSALMVLESGSRTPLLSLRSEELLEFEVGGPGSYSTGGGFVGGGFGVQGALTGMAMADLLNAATTRSHIETNVRVTTSTITLVLQSTQVTPETIQRSAPVVSPRAAAAPSPDLAAQLQQLAALHASGALTDDEFQVAKARVLGGP